MKYQRVYSNGQQSVYSNFWRLAVQMLVLGFTYQASRANTTNNISLEKPSNVTLLSSTKQNNLTVIDENTFDVTSNCKVDQYQSDADSSLKELNHTSSLKLVARSYLCYGNNNIDAWSYKVRRNNHGQIKNFAKECTTEFNAILEELIEKAYSSLYSVENILKFIRDLPYISNLITGYSALFDQMKSNNDLDSYQLLMLAYGIKETMEMDNYYTMSQTYQNKMEDLKNKLPSSLLRLVWIKESCTIKNRRWNEYLYAASNFINNDSYRRLVYTWKPQGTVSQGYWIITPENNGRHFVIYNTEHKEYLYAASNGYALNNQRRRVFTNTTGENVRRGQWEVTPINNGEYFTLKSVQYVGEHLYADENYEYDSNKRGVFTWRNGQPVGDIITESHWKISC